MFGFALVSYFVPVAGSEWSVAQFVVSEDEAKDEGAKAVITDGYIHVLTKIGKYYRARFNDQTKGELKSE